MGIVPAALAMKVHGWIAGIIGRRAILPIFSLEALQTGHASISVPSTVKCSSLVSPLTCAFAAMINFGAFATIRHRLAIYCVISLTIVTLGVNLMAEFGPSYRFVQVDSALRMACLSIMFCMTLKRTLRPGRISGYRVLGGIAGYLLIGLTWAFAYQLLLQQNPSAIHFEPGVAENLPGQPSNLIYFSFITLTTVGFGDVHPVTPAARALTLAEALVSQLYIAILIASLVGMALQATSMDKAAEEPAPSLHA